MSQETEFFDCDDDGDLIQDQIQQEIDPKQQKMQRLNDKYSIKQFENVLNCVLIPPDDISKDNVNDLVENIRIISEFIVFGEKYKDA